MENQNIKQASKEKALFVKMAIDAWQTQNTRVDKLLASLTDEDLMMEVAPGRNRGIYLLGHLAAVNDNMIALLGFGQKMYPDLHQIYITSADKAVAETPTLEELRRYWNEINSTLNIKINETEPDEWFNRHTSVSVEDFAKEPHRNKLNILINRAAHTSYHLGQLNFLVKKAK